MAGKGRGYFFSSFLTLPAASRTLQVDPGTVLYFFIIKTSGRVNKGEGFLELLEKFNDCFTL